MQPIWIFVVIFAATCGMLYVVADLGSRRRRRVYDRLSQLERVWAAPVPTAVAEAAPSAGPRDVLPFVSQALERHGLGERLKLSLTQAGISLRPYEFVVGMAVAGCVGLTVGLVMHKPMLAGLLTVLGLVTPVIVVQGMRSSRLAKFSDQLPDALTLIASSIRSGYSFMRAIQVAATELPEPIRHEFERCLRESEIGIDVPTALQNMHRRVPNYDLELCVTAVGIQMQVGGNLSEVLDTIAETIRARIRTRRHIAALTAEGKLTWLTATLAPVVMFFAMSGLNPNYMAPLYSGVGRLLLVAAAALMVLGSFVIAQMLKVEL